MVSGQSGVMCCFCGGPLQQYEAVELAWTAPEDRAAVQGAYAHASCMVDRIHLSVPLLPDIAERAERDGSKQ